MNLRNAHKAYNVSNENHILNTLRFEEKETIICNFVSFVFFPPGGSCGFAAEVTKWRLYRGQPARTIRLLWWEQYLIE